MGGATEFIPGCASELMSSPERSPNKLLPPLPVWEGIRGGAWTLLAVITGLGLLPERELVRCERDPVLLRGSNSSSSSSVNISRESSPPSPPPCCFSSATRSVGADAGSETPFMALESDSEDWNGKMKPQVITILQAQYKGKTTSVFLYSGLPKF